MKSPENSKDVFASLTPKEQAVLRERLGIENVSDDDAVNPNTPPPSIDDSDDGSGGVPASPPPLVP